MAAQLAFAPVLGSSVPVPSPLRDKCFGGRGSEAHRGHLQGPQPCLSILYLRSEECQACPPQSAGWSRRSQIPALQHVQKSTTKVLLTPRPPSPAPWLPHERPPTQLSYLGRTSHEASGVCALLGPALVELGALALHKHSGTPVRITGLSWVVPAARAGSETCADLHGGKRAVSMDDSGDGEGEELLLWVKT